MGVHYNKFIKNLTVKFEGSDDEEKCYVYNNNEFYFLKDEHGQHIFYAYTLKEMYKIIELQGHKIITKRGESYAIYRAW